MFDAHLTEWLTLAVRWLHLMFGAAWIGTSFYFVWLNNHVRPADGEPDPSVKGDVWSVHGGAFYRVLKFDGAPRTLPKTLHWFYWDAYLTWMTGTALLVFVYWLRPTTWMVDPNIAALAPWQAVAIGVGTIVFGWLGYDLLCRSPLRASAKALSGVGVLLLVGVIYLLTHTLGPRAAYIHIGAMLGTIMAGNVFFVIIPGQRKMVDAMMRGEAPDTRFGAAGAMRSLHNNYLTLPVLFLMISNHYPITYGHPASWAILVALALIGGTYRHYENRKEQGRPVPWLAPAAAVGLVALAFVTKPAPPASAAHAVSFAQVRELVDEHCVACHADEPTQAGFPEPPKGLSFDDPSVIALRAAQIHEQVAVSRIMPLGNLTKMTEEERAIIARWYADGAGLE